MSAVAATSVSPVQRAIAMVSIVMAMLVVSMDTTITNTTMPHIAGELGGGLHWYAWTFTAYMIFSTVMAPIAGRISDLFGRRTIFGFGLLLFLAGSLLCGFAGSMLQLVLFRAVQGLGAGLVQPFPMIIAGDLFSIEKRGKIQALFTAMWGLSAVLAPLVGSAFVETVGWRWIFWVNIPICVLSFVLLYGYKEVYQAKKAKVDVGGAAMFALGVSLLLLVTVEIEGAAWYGAAGALVLAGFLLYERRQRTPILPLGLFRNRPIRWMTLNNFLATAALFGTSSFLPLFLQDQGYSLFWSGIALIGQAIGWMGTSVPAGRWILKYGYGRLVVVGNILLVLSGVLLLFLGAGVGFWYALTVMIVQGMAFGLLSTVSTIGAQQLVDPHEKGVSTSLQLFSRNVGTACGVTIMGALLTAAPDVVTGIAHLFRYGAAFSVLALLSSLLLLRRASAAAEAASSRP